MFPCADQAPSTIPDALADKGWQVRRVEAYRTVALAPPDPVTLEHMALADAVIFVAASSATAYAALTSSDGSPLPVPPMVICIGTTTAQRARALGMEGVTEAHGASTEGIVDALIDRVAGTRTGGS